MRDITDEEYHFLRKILDKPDAEPTQEEYAQAVEIFKQIRFMSVQPRPQSDKYTWQVIRNHHFCVDKKTAFVFTNDFDSYFYMTQILKWPPEAIETPEVDNFSFLDVLYASMERLVIIDYQIEPNRGFFMYDSKKNLLSVCVRGAETENESQSLRNNAQHHHIDGERKHH